MENEVLEGYFWATYKEDPYCKHIIQVIGQNVFVMGWSEPTPIEEYTIYEYIGKEQEIEAELVFN